MGNSVKKIAENEPFQMGNKVFEYKIEDGAIKLSKVRDIKSKPSFTPPSLQEVKDYFKLKGYTEDSAVKFHEYYEEGEWRDSGGKPVKNWKQKAMSVWFTEKNKIQITPVKTGTKFFQE